MEAKRAAEQARRAAIERAAAAAVLPTPVLPVAVQQGLPQGSTWGSVAAKAGAGWKQPVVGTVTPGATSVVVGGGSVMGTSPGKKTMAQIQKEEEEERARLAAKTKDVPGLGVGVRGYAGAAASTATKVVSLSPNL